MTRPKKNRKVKAPPLFHTFKPAGIKKRNLEQVTITLSEFEAIRLADHQGMDHLEASQHMDISRSTFTRLIEKARRKLSELIIQGKVLTIEGGNFHFKENLIKCKDCSHIFVADIKEDINNCNICDSQNLTNLAENFGHGRCCRGKIKKRGF